MSCSETYTHKRGASFDVLVTIPAQFADGYFADYTPASQVRTPDGTLVASLTCAWVDAVTTRALRLTCIDTNAWPIGAVAFDVRFKRSTDNHVIPSSTEQFIVLKNITQEAPAP